MCLRGLTNEKLHFLILLDDEDFLKNTWYCNNSHKDLIMKKKKTFPGKLNIINYDDIDKPNIMKDYIIESNPVPREVYIKLPKENLYVLSEKFAQKYLLSRHSELKNIFEKLGAKSIEWKMKHNNGTSDAVNLDMEVNVNQIGVMVGVDLEESSDNSNKAYSKMTFPNNKVQLDEKIFDDPSFYYLSKEYEWQNIIQSRIHSRNSEYEFFYKNTDSYNFKSDMSSKLKLLNINFGYETNKYNNLEIHYIVKYWDT